MNNKICSLIHRWAGGPEFHHAGLGRTASLQPSCYVPVGLGKTQSLLTQEPGIWGVGQEDGKQVHDNKIFMLNLAEFDFVSTERCESEVWVQRREEVRLCSLILSEQISCCSLFIFLLLCRILQFSRPVKLEDLKTKAKVAFGQTMDLHYTNNEVQGWKL